MKITTSLCIFLPTYNEEENIKELIEELEKLPYNIRIVVVDDSTDGTTAILSQLANKYNNIRVIHREKEKGRGTAGKLGLIEALKEDVEYIIEMDADLSHPVEFIKPMVEEIKNYDLVIGSRYIKGGKEVNRSIVRRLISLLANMYVRRVLGVNIRDCTSGYRVYRKELLKTINLDNLISSTQAVVIEILYNIYKNGFRIKEVPITYIERKKGKSKLTLRKLLSILFIVWQFKKNEI